MRKMMVAMGVLMAGVGLAENNGHVRLLETMDLSHRLPGEHAVRPNYSAVTGRNVPDGDRMFVGGNVQWVGMGVRTPSKVTIPLGDGALCLTTKCALDDWSKTGEAIFNVLTNNVLAASSGVMRAGDAARTLKIDLRGASTCTLESVSADGECVYADWFNTVFRYAEGQFPPNDVRRHSRQLGILTPREDKAPRINGPSVLGVRPGRPLIWRLPVTGSRPVRLCLDAAPAGVSFDGEKQVLSGCVSTSGDYALHFTAENAYGRAERTVFLKVGDTIALTPPMGFNSWNCHQSEVTQEKMCRSVDALVASGLADHGYSYVVVDDFWQNDGEKNWNAWHARRPDLHGPMRAADGRILSNRNFPDMSQLADYVHAHGLRAGLYSSPGKLTCGGCAGSFGYEALDARTYAEWGFDFLKYDWCSYWDEAFGSGEWKWMHPYMKMGCAIKAQNRDIVFSLCEYGNANVSSWGNAVHGQCWRTTGDVIDTWPSISRSIELQKRLWVYSRPGAWNDPDMLCVGKMNWNEFKGSRLAPNEQYTHVSIWALVASPLMIGCDMSRLDDFTYSLLANDEVIAINQDPLGAGAGVVDEGEGWEVWARPLADGSIAAGLYNKSLEERTVVLDMEKLGIQCKWTVRDVWAQADVGVFLGKYEQSVPGHATHLVRLTPKACGRLRAGMNDIRDNAWQLMMEMEKRKGNQGE